MFVTLLGELMDCYIFSKELVKIALQPSYKLSSMKNSVYIFILLTIPVFHDGTGTRRHFAFFPYDSSEKTPLALIESLQIAYQFLGLVSCRTGCHAVCV